MSWDGVPAGGRFPGDGVRSEFLGSGCGPVPSHSVVQTAPITAAPSNAAARATEILSGVMPPSAMIRLPGPETGNSVGMAVGIGFAVSSVRSRSLRHASAGSIPAR